MSLLHNVCKRLKQEGWAMRRLLRRRHDSGGERLYAKIQTLRITVSGIPHALPAPS